MKKTLAVLLIMLVTAVPVLACCCPEDSKQITTSHAHHDDVKNHRESKHSDCEKPELQVIAKPVSTLLPDLKVKHSFDNLVNNNGLAHLSLSGIIVQDDLPDRRLPVIASTPIFLSTKRLRI